MDSLTYADKIVREYLLFRGFTNTARAFDIEANTDRNAAYDPDKITSMLLQYAQSLDHVGLTATWSYFDVHFFARLPSTVYRSSVKKLLVSLQRYLIISAVLQKKSKHIHQFFDAHPEFTADPDWVVWFALPFVKRPETDPRYELYFSKMWLEIFTTSLRNFIGFVFANLPLPTLLNFNVERVKRKTLELEVAKLHEEVDDLKQRLAKKASMLKSASSVTSLSTFPQSANSHDEDAFIILHEETLSLHDDNAISTLSLSADATVMASVDVKNCLSIWSQLKPALPAVKITLPAECKSLMWHMQGNVRQLIIGLNTGSIRIYTIDTRLILLRDIKCPANTITNLQVAGTSSLIASLLTVEPGQSRPTSSIIVWSMKSWEVEGAIYLPEAIALLLSNKSGNTAVACALSGSVFVIDITSKSLQQVFSVDCYISGASLSIDGSALYLILKSSQLVKYSLEGVPDPLQTHSLLNYMPLTSQLANGQVSPPSIVCFSPTVDYVIVGVTVYNVTTGKVAHKMDNAHRDNFSNTAVSTPINKLQAMVVCADWQGNTWAFGTQDGTVKITKMIYT